MSPRVLIVDDEGNIRAETVELVENKGYRVEEAGDGLEGIQMFERDPQDLVITDIRMPGVDGYELIRRIREGYPDVPIIAVTGHFSATDLKEAKDAGATIILKKPINPLELSQQLDLLLEPTED